MPPLPTHPISCLSSRLPKKNARKGPAFGSVQRRHLRPQGTAFPVPPCSPRALVGYWYPAPLPFIKQQHLNLLFHTLLADGYKCFMSSWACSITILLEAWISLPGSCTVSEVVLSLEHVNLALVMKWTAAGCCGWCSEMVWCVWNTSGCPGVIVGSGELDYK